MNEIKIMMCDEKIILDYLGGGNVITKVLIRERYEG